MLERIREDVKIAMKAGDKMKVSVLRMVLADVKNAQIRKGEELGENEILSLVQKAIKRREEAASAFREGGREDLAEKEDREAEILFGYMPKQLGPEEIEKVVEEVIEELGAATKRDIGPVMKTIMSRYQGRLDGKAVQALVSSKLV